MERDIQDRVIEIAIEVAAEGSYLDWQELNEEDPESLAFFGAHTSPILAISDNLRPLIRENYDRLQEDASNG